MPAPGVSRLHPAVGGRSRNHGETRSALRLVAERRSARPSPDDPAAARPDLGACKGHQGEQDSLKCCRRNAHL